MINRAVLWLKYQINPIYKNKKSTWLLMCGGQTNSGFTSWLTVTCSLFSSAAVTQNEDGPAVYLKSCSGGHITLSPCTLECQQHVRWRSNPVSPTSAYLATMSRGTRGSVTRCVQILNSFIFSWYVWVNIIWASDSTPYVYMDSLVVAFFF